MAKKQSRVALRSLTAVYTGRRLIGSKVYRRFEHPDGTERLFAGVRGVYIGSTYYLGAKAIALRPERVHEAEQINNPEWDAADALVDAHNAGKLAERKLQSLEKPALKAAVTALSILTKEMDFFERRKLIEHLAMETNPNKAKKK